MSDGYCQHCGLPVPGNRRGGDAARVAAFCCYGCRLAFQIARGARHGEPGQPGNTLLFRLGLGVFLTMNLMIFNWPLYGRHVFEPGGADGLGALGPLLAYLLMFLATLVIATLGVPLAADAFDFKHRGWHIDSSALIVLGVLAAYGLSVINTLRGRDELYFDTAALILVLVTLGKYLESLAKVSATATRVDLLKKLPDQVRVKRDNATLTVHRDALQIGDLVLVAHGQIAAVDGTVVEGRGEMDQSDLTGQQLPQPVKPGDAVLAGSMNLGQACWVRVTRLGDNLAVARMQALLDRARQREPNIQRLADRISAVFVPGVLLLGLAVFVIHAAAGQWHRALNDALSVLLISCPCALGLAAPLATWRAIDAAARRGIFIAGGRSLEQLAAIRHVFFDKTGTLTEPNLAVLKVTALDNKHSEETILALAAGLEQVSDHPIARAIVRQARAQKLSIPTARDVIDHPGRGVRGEMHQRTYRLGDPRWLDASHRFEPSDVAGGERVIALADHEALLGGITLGERLRDDAPATVRALADMGITASLLTGDHEAGAKHVADALGIDHRANLLPDDKVRQVESNTKRPAAMVGDGLNDAAVLASAEVGLALGRAADLTRQAGQVHLVSDRLGDVAALMGLARRTHRRIKFNLLWAFGYNTVGITLAATGRLNPVVAALLMIFSSLMIIATSRGAGRMPGDQPDHVTAHGGHDQPAIQAGAPA